MTLKIEVMIPEDEVRSGAAAQYLKRAMQAIGFSAAYEAAAKDAVVYGTGAVLVSPEGSQAVNLRMTDEDATAQKAEAIAATEMVEEAKRERAKPAPARGRKPKETAAEEPIAPAISTGEERIDPTTVEDAAQDEEDEAAEVEAAPAADLTHDDVRAALKGYLDTYGTAAAMEDGPKVLKMLFGDKALKVSDVPTDQASLAKAIAGIDEMRGKNPFSREPQL